MQDKFRYIDLCKNICIPSIAIQRSEIAKDGTLPFQLKAKIKDWASKHYEIGKNSLGGWIVKCPFTTGTFYVVDLSFMAA